MKVFPFDSEPDGYSTSGGQVVNIVAEEVRTGAIPQTVITAHQAGNSRSSRKWYASLHCGP